MITRRGRGRRQGRGGGGVGVLADPLVAPGVVVLLVVAERVVDRHQLVGDHFAVRAVATGDLQDRDVHLPLRARALGPARGAPVPEREALGGEVVGVPDADHGVGLGLRLRIGLVEDRVHARAGRRRPAAEHPRAGEGVPAQRAQPDHSGPSLGPLLVLADGLGRHHRVGGQAGGGDGRGEHGPTPLEGLVPGVGVDQQLGAVAGAADPGRDATARGHRVGQLDDLGHGPLPVALRLHADAPPGHDRPPQANVGSSAASSARLLRS